MLFLNWRPHDETDMRINIGCVTIAAALLALASCDQKEAQRPTPRPVRTEVVAHTGGGELVSLSGQIQARNQVNLAFRIDGRLVDREVDVGDQLTNNQVVAHLDSQDAQNGVRSAEADLSAAQASLTLARSTEARQAALLGPGYTTRAQHDQAVQQLQAAQSQVDAAQARLHSAKDNLGYTELHSDVAGSVTAKGAEPGEVVHAGQMILRVAQQGGTDAVFNVPAQLIRASPADPLVTIALSDDPAVTATGHIREIAPQADPTTGTYLVKVGLDNPPGVMRLGATIVGSVRTNGKPTIQIPGIALTEEDGKPAVWVFNPAQKTVELRQVQVLRYTPALVVVSDGLKDGEIVVTAGVHALHPGELVRQLDASGNPPR
jgi:membrane fusion protein, multidrug efflux system